MATKTKTPAKKKPTPLLIHAAVRGGIGMGTLEDMLLLLTSKALAEHLRSRSIPIPKDKVQMAERLASHFYDAPGRRYTLTIA